MSHNDAMRPYYLLLVRPLDESGYLIEFGDYHRDVVEQELRDCRDSGEMTRMQDDLDGRGNLWREFVGLVGDWFAEADFQPLSENHRDVLMAKHEAVLQFGAEKLYADDSHTSENFLAAVLTKDMSRCQRLWQPLVKQIAANHKMIADGTKAGSRYEIVSAATAKPCDVDVAVNLLNSKMNCKVICKGGLISDLV